MAYTFICEKCGKTVQSNSDPSKWKQRVCFDCKNASGQVVSKSPTQRYVPPSQKPEVKTSAFDLKTYVSEMIVVFQEIYTQCQENNLDIPIENMCNWTTSVMIQKGR
jgi:hypothetical protein